MTVEASRLEPFFTILGERELTDRNSFETLETPRVEEEKKEKKKTEEIPTRSITARKKRSKIVSARAGDPRAEVS